MSIKVKYLKVPADASKPMEVVELSGLEQLREGIGGGWIEGVNLRKTSHCPGARMYCDEEFAFKPELGVNFRASIMAQLGGVFPMPDQVIGGDVLLFDLSRGENDKSVSDQTVAWARKLEEVLKKKGVL